MPGLKKRSVVLKGHPTSVALEPEFWTVLQAMSARREVSLAALISGLDETRGESLLASHCRKSALAFLINELPPHKQQMFA
jgi:predicted DNA-binding ribbon-helix-helix protein